LTKQANNTIFGKKQHHTKLFGSWPTSGAFTRTPLLGHGTCHLIHWTGGFIFLTRRADI